MAIDEKVVTHVRAALADASHVREVKMFGGLGFMLNGNMVAASSDRGLLVRVGEVGLSEALSRGAQQMVMRGRMLKDYVWVTDPLNARNVKSWLRLARAFVETLPVKEETKKQSPSGARKRQQSRRV
ncbi:MAG TPA: TfoX/Sxy family protein [Polyangiaceae bacterium]|jgi:TfoX/Sxy family transcriptional regulator of competence genes|nr:TfoX/Sxy family protein [Polyangiaceae bacterium]